MLASRAPDLFWLDAGADAADGWSLVGTGVPATAGDPETVRLDVEAQPLADLPPFRGGWIGWWDYESGAVAAGVPAAASEGGPVWMRVTAALAVNHATGEVWQLGEELPLGDFTGEAAPDGPAAAVTASARHTPEEYAALIARCRAAIRAGDAYQLCLTTRFTVLGTYDPVAVYRSLRRVTPAHHGGFVRIAGRALLSASPETFLRVSGGTIRTRPIKGTRPRGADPIADAALAEELRTSEKERAENVMIVDLMRNDLSRVCEPGSIRVEGLCEVESYPAVHQLVSTVAGTAAVGVTVRDLRAAAFPAGSMTGAPKLSAMTILHSLEGGAPRGVYSGCFGYIGVDGTVDLAMVIRSIVIDDRGAVVGAGGGITWRSDADAEVAEVALKARAPLAALGAVLPPIWRHG